MQLTTIAWPVHHNCSLSLHQHLRVALKWVLQGWRKSISLNRAGLNLANPNQSATEKATIDVMTKGSLSDPDDMVRFDKLRKVNIKTAKTLSVVKLNRKRLHLEALPTLPAAADSFWKCCSSSGSSWASSVIALSQSSLACAAMSPSKSVSKNLQSSSKGGYIEVYKKMFESLQELAEKEWLLKCIKR